MVSPEEADFVHPSNIFVDESLDNDDEYVVSSNNHEVDISEYSRISDEDETSTCAPPYSPIMSDVTDCTNSDDNFDEFDYDETVPTESDNVLFATPVEVENTTMSMWPGFKLVIDNVNKNIRPTFQRIDRQTQSLHYCHTIAIKDRIDLSKYSELSCSNLLKISDFLPNAQDLKLIKKDFQILVYRLVLIQTDLILVHYFYLILRVIVQYIPSFFSEGKFVQWHIPSKFSEEMRRKSVVVSSYSVEFCV